MASLQDLLADEVAFRSEQFFKNSTPRKLKHRVPLDDSTTKKTMKNNVTRKGSSGFSCNRSVSNSDKSISMSSTSGGNESAIDELAIQTVISILSGYTGRFVKDANFREIIRDKFNCFLRRRSNVSDDNGILANMELGFDSIEKLVKNQEMNKEKLLMISIRLLNIVESFNSKKIINHNSTSGIPNSLLSAFAQFYIAIVYKLQKNDGVSAKHLLQVFVDSPFLARTYLLPDLWEQFFLPPLLHLKIWYHKELEFLSNLDDGENEERMEALNKVYNDQMDMGTTLFALHYKQWLKAGAKAPAVPAVPLPSRSSYRSSRRTSSDSYASHSSINTNRFGAVFGPTHERRSMDVDQLNRASINQWSLKEKTSVCTYEDFNVHNNRSCRRSNHNHRNPKTKPHKSDYFRFCTCRDVRTEFLVNANHIARNSTTRSEDNASIELSKAISNICCSDNLSECENAIRVIAKTWLNSHGDPVIEAKLSKAHIIEGMLQVLFASNDDEILELAISILAEFVSNSELNRQIILNSDPQLDIFKRLLRSSSLFLKAAVLLYLLKPKAKQMVSIEWVPLVLRVLEFGDHLQTLFTVSCKAQVAAFYFLDQILHGFDEDKNLENAREVVSLGGLGLLVGRIEKGDIHERNKTASFILCCIRADESCQNYLVENLKY